MSYYLPAVAVVATASVIALAAIGSTAKILAIVDHPIENGWYSRADSKAVGADITPWNRSQGETGVRCLCGAKGVRGADVGDGFFVITSAPEGYSDTVGRRFRSRPVNCGNCAD